MSLLEVEGLGVRFGGHQAVDDVALTADAGRLTGLIGPNGAGKTTTFNAITGLQTTSSGTVRFDGHDLSSTSAHRRARAGMSRTFQRLELFGSLTVTENILSAAEIRSGWAGGGDPPGETRALLERLDLVQLAGERADSLTTGQARIVELARALACQPRLLLLDEPASGLTETESEDFGRLLRELVDVGMAILLVEHDVPLVMGVCDHIYVLDLGRNLAQGSPAEVQADPLVLDAYLGAVVR